ncbi:hypothetical protein TSAR_002660 [Trichomalopsis sarcophagae]|uniref:Uncharacterized protein n=1 Tax=Trichomalopsis sarcophagae TaxID=543379 RepID=A0A232ET47_9HYME|nr:hypothetical protein TSAR_002660 [Trichomalopsis sarcophagae]
MIKDMADDEATQATNDDASECKRSAVQLGYWTDNFISLFVKQPNRKAPEINRGYYARVKGIEVFLDKFLKLHQLVYINKTWNKINLIRGALTWPWPNSVGCA